MLFTVLSNPRSRPRTIKIKLKVNGEVRTVDADPDTPLAYVLRNQLRLTGTKIRCGKEQCGACAVLVDGEVMMSFVRAAVQFGDREIGQ